jgi:hypothetical protein
VTRCSIEKHWTRIQPRVKWYGQRARPTRQSRASRNSCVSCLQWQVGLALEAQQFRLFAFQGRCFDQALAANEGRTRDSLQRMMGRSGKSREIGGHPQSSLKARVAVKASRLVKASSTARSADTLTRRVGAECRRRTSKSDALYSRARRANFQTVSQEQSYKVMVGLALRNRGALEIMKSGAMRAVVLPGWPNGEHHPMGPCYVSKPTPSGQPAL